MSGHAIMFALIIPHFFICVHLGYDPWLKNGCWLLPGERSFRGPRVVGLLTASRTGFKRPLPWACKHRCLGVTVLFRVVVLMVGDRNSRKLASISGSKAVVSSWFSWYSGGFGSVPGHRISE